MSNTMSRFKGSLVEKAISDERIGAVRIVLRIGDQRLVLRVEGVNTIDAANRLMTGRRVFTPDQVEGATSVDGLLGVVVDFDASWTAFIRSGL